MLMRYDRRVRLALIFLVVFAAVAHAGEHDATFAKAFSVTVSQVHDVAGFELPAGNDATHVVIGRYDHGKYVMTGALLMKCSDTECTWRRAEFGAADAIEVAGIVDLHGGPTAIPARALTRSSGRYAKVPGARSMKFPAVVIRTRESQQTTNQPRPRKQVTGTETRARLYLISLIDSDRASVVLMDTAEERLPSGRGFTRSYRLDKGDAKGALDVIAKEQRSLDIDSRCLRPEPTEAVFALEERHYRTKKYALGKGC